MTIIGSIWLFVGICFTVWFLEQIIDLIKDFIIVCKNYFKELKNETNIN